MDGLLESKLTSEFISYVKSIVGDYRYVEQGCESTLKKLLQLREESYFKEDLDEFELFLKEHIDKLNEYKRTRFPIGSVDLNEIQYQDLVIVWG
jgi:hypothetical protein